MPSAQEHVSLLITGGTLLTMDESNRVLDDGAVAVRGNRIVDIGPRPELMARYRADRVIDASRHAVLPGLIDTHGHGGHSLARSIGAHTTAVGWRVMIDHVYFRSTTADFWYADGLLSALERLKFGVVTGMAMLGSAPRADAPEFARAFARGYGDVGLRVIVGVGPARPPWPRTFSYWDGLARTDREVSYEQVIDVTEELLAVDNGSWNGRVNMWPTASRFLTPSALDQMFDASQLPIAARQADDLRRLADRYATGIHAHAYGGSIQYVADNFPHLLGPDVLLAHCTGLEPSEIDVLARTRTAVSHCPTSTRYTEDHQPCPVPQLLEAGARVAIGSDGAQNSSFDLFKDIRQAIYIQRYEQQDRYVLPPGKALKMVTIDAAHAIGRGDDLGSLEIGKLADIILVDLWQPHLQPVDLLVEQLVTKALGSDVDMVVCDGVVVLDTRHANLVDEDEILRRAQRESALMWERSGMQPLRGTPAGFWDCSRY